MTETGCRVCRAAIAAAVLAAAAQPGQAGQWTEPAGDNGYFSYSNGQDLHGRFGDPGVTGTGTFVFFGNDFSLTAADGGSPIPLSDTVSFDLLAHPGRRFDRITVVADGGFAITGAPTTNTVGVNTLLTATELAGAPPREWMGTWDWQTDDTTGTWSGENNLDLGLIDPPASDSIRIDLTLELTASSDVGGSASVNVGPSLLISVLTIPEPGTLGLVALGGCGMWRRRRS